MGSRKTTEAAYFMLLKDMDILLLQATSNLELHKLLQTNPESGIELWDLKINPGYLGPQSQASRKN